MIRPLAFAALLLALLVPAAQAQDLDCHANDLHYVIGMPDTATGATTYRVGDFTTPDAVNPCTADAPFTRQFTAEAGNILSFLVIADDLLVLTESTGPQYFLEIYDLAETAPRLKVDAYDVEPSERGIRYYEAIEPATPQNCARYAELTAGGIGAILGAERFFAFATGRSEPGKATRCYQTP